MIEKIELELKKYIGTGNLDFNKKLLQITENGYGKNDKLLNVNSPSLRKIAKKYYKEISIKDVNNLLHSRYHEYRLLSLIIMTFKYNENKDIIFKLYIDNINNVNNWDLVDISSPKIIGKYLMDNYDDEEIYKFLSCLYDSDNFWYRRISIVATLELIKNNKLDLVLEFLKTTIKDTSPLNNKALGWMLREVYKKDSKRAIYFIKNNKLKNITFNYATEKMDKQNKISLKKIALLFIMLLFPFNIFATSGAISSDNIVNVNNKLYGFHGKNNHCHLVYKKSGQYYASKEVSDSYCKNIVKTKAIVSKKSQQREDIILKSCVDGDTAKFKIDGKTKTVRFLAIDTEESVSKKKLNTYMGKKASEYTCNKLKKASKIEIEFDSKSTKTDKYNRTLGWIYIDGVLFQKDLVRKGYAKVAYLYGNYKYIPDLKKEEEIARKTKIGIWNKKDIVARTYNAIQKFLKMFT